MNQLGHTDRLIAVPQSSRGSVFDVYSLRVTAADFILYDAFEQLYDGGTISDMTSLSTSAFVEKIVDLLPDGAVKRWEVIGLGVGHDRLHEMRELDFLLSHVLYVVEPTQFKVYYPLWTGVDVGGHVLQTADGDHVIWKYEKDKTTRNRDDFISNLDTVSRSNSQSHIDIQSADVGWQVSRALLTASARCNSDRADYWNGDARFAVGETDDEWLVIKYHRDWDESMASNGLLLRLPASDKGTFTNTYTRIMRGTENGRWEMYGRLQESSRYDSSDEASRVFRKHVMKQFDALIPDFIDG